MVRSYGDPVHVRESVHQQRKPGTPSTSPHAFIWKGRLYVVRDVLAHWYERRAWWTEGVARAVHGAEPDGSQPELGAVCDELAGDREIWRVEASAGRYADTGVYDLCRSGGSGDDRMEPWQLLRVAD